MLRGTVSGIVFTLILVGLFSILFPIRTNAIVEQWVPYIPRVNIVTLSYWAKGGISYMNTTIEFPVPCFNVSDWGTPTTSGNTVSVNSEIWAWTGICIQVVTPMSHIYSLGYLPMGKYSFVFKAWGIPVTSIVFDVYENVTTHEGDLVIDGTQTLVIENCTYIQTGSIQVRDWGKLIVRNSELRINQTYLRQYDFAIEDYGTLEFENSIVTSDQLLSPDFNEHSTANINNVTLDLPGGSHASFNGFSKATIRQLTFPRVGWGTLFFNDHSEASITNSQIQEIQVWDGECSIETSNSSIAWFSLSFNSGYKVKVDYLKPGFYEYLNLQEKVTIPSIIYDVTLNNTLVDMWAVHINYDSKTAISDSTIGRLLIFIQGLSVRLDNLRPQFYEYKQMGQISLNSTSITSYIVVSVFDSIVTIANSAVDLSPVFDSDVYVVDSLVSLQTEHFSGSLCFERTTLRNRLLIFYADFFMYGNVSFEDVQVIELFLVNIKRNYNIILRDINYSPVENVGLTLFDHDSTVVWSGTTGSLGETDFNLTFTDSNYTDTFSLKAFKESFYHTIQQVSLLSDTPIVVNLAEKPLGDINEDYIVNILDISIVARAYDSEPGQQRWNQAADLNKDETVDILDVSLVARDYGKAV